jgi:5-methylcytosine-specific restriction endonuclease McrA
MQDSEKRKQYKREWHRKNRDKVIANVKRWREENPDRRRELEREGYKHNREKRLVQKKEARQTDGYRAYNREIQRRRRERLRNVAEGGCLEAEYSSVLFSDPCSYCGQPTQAIDHIDPISQGGDGSWENLTGACTHCNSSKGTKSLLEFLCL